MKIYIQHQPHKVIHIVHGKIIFKLNAIFVLCFALLVYSLWVPAGPSGVPILAFGMNGDCLRRALLSLFEPSSSPTSSFL